MTVQSVYDSYHSGGVTRVIGTVTEWMGADKERRKPYVLVPIVQDVTSILEPATLSHSVSAGHIAKHGLGQ